MFEISLLVCDNLQCPFHDTEIVRAPVCPKEALQENRQVYEGHREESFSRQHSGPRAKVVHDAFKLLSVRMVLIFLYFLSWLYRKRSESVSSSQTLVNGVVEINVGTNRPLVTFGAKNDQRPASAASDTASVSDGNPHLLACV